jgi:branched-subunit amino acid aminotransferase/4-amino-4-deoxychorismate lyase
VNAAGQITEGTRTNFLGIKDKTIFSPPQEKILLGVTRKALLTSATRTGYALIQKDMMLQELGEYDNIFLTSTSSKILPIRTIDEREYKPPTEALKTLTSLYDRFLEESKGILS